MEDLKELKVKNWEETAKDRRTWLRRRNPTKGFIARWWRWNFEWAQWSEKGE